MANVNALGGILKHIGNYDEMQTFDGRLRLQKTIYLMQAFDLYIGYNFSWYIRGPYCTELTKDGFLLREIWDKLPFVRFRDVEAQERFMKFFQFLDKNRNDSDWLEIIASIHFLKKVYPNFHKQKILNIVKNKQPYFTMKQCEESWTHLERWKMI